MHGAAEHGSGVCMGGQLPADEGRDIGGEKVAMGCCNSKGQEHRDPCHQSRRDSHDYDILIVRFPGNSTLCGVELNGTLQSVQEIASYQQW